MARPSEYTQDTASAICAALAEGQSLRKICEADDMPDKATVFRWLAKYPEFRDQYARAREAQADVMAEEILDIADDSAGDLAVDQNGNERMNSEFVARARLRVDARKWLLSKLVPKKYGEKLAVGGADDLPPLQAKVSVEFVNQDTSGV